jgi:hypothetical protein
MSRGFLCHGLAFVATMFFWQGLASTASADPVITGSPAIPTQTYESPTPVQFQPALGPGQTITRFKPNNIVPANGQPGDLAIPPDPGGGAPFSGTASITGLIDLIINGVQYLAPIIGNIFVNGLNNLPATTTFNTQMMQLDIAGGNLPPGEMLRVSPTISSTGQATITDIGGGQFRIDSFFDVFTELSLDGGQTWAPASGPLAMTSVPEPSSVALMATGGSLLALIAWRRRRRT